MEPRTPEVKGCIYLSAPIDVVMDRLQKRNRAEESKMDPEYQRKLIQKHDDLFLAGGSSLVTCLTPIATQTPTTCAPIPEDSSLNLEDSEEATGSSKTSLNSLSTQKSTTVQQDTFLKAGENRFGRPTLVIDASRDFEHDTERFLQICDKLKVFLETIGYEL